MTIQIINNIIILGEGDDDDDDDDDDDIGEEDVKPLNPSNKSLYILDENLILGVPRIRQVNFSFSIRILGH